MKKLLSIGLLTLGVLAISERPAHAWVNAKFSVGLNWHLQSANNNTLWGVYKNGQVPGPEAFGQPGNPYGQMAPGMTAPGGMNQPAGVFPFFGVNPQGYPQGYPQGTPASYPTETAPPPTLASQGQQAYYPQNWYQNPYQAVSYQTGGYYYPSQYYPSQTYSSQYYPNYYQGYYQAPAYWYQSR